MTHRVLNMHKAYCDVMKTTMKRIPVCHHKTVVVMRMIGALDCCHDVTIYIPIFIYIHIYMYL